MCSVGTTWHIPEITEEDANAVIALLLDIVLQSTHCLDSRLRWSDTLYKLLRQLRETASLTIDWQPLYQLLRTALREGLHNFSGAPLHAHAEAALLVP